MEQVKRDPKDNVEIKKKKIVIQPKCLNAR